MSATWEQFVANMNVYEPFLTLVFEAARRSSFSPLRENLLKILEEEGFHTQFAVEWARLLAANEKVKQDLALHIKNALAELKQNVTLLHTEKLVAEQILAESIQDLFAKHEHQVLQLING